MNAKTPSFWYRPPGSPTPLPEKLLVPLSWLYSFGRWYHKNTARCETASIPIICIGNVNAGGTGKTPTALAILSLIRRAHLAKKPHFLLRGYGGGERGPLLVDSVAHNSWDTGDEALILAKTAPTVVSADRVAGANFAKHQGADLVVMDDGLQNPGIHKDVKLIVINGEMGFGNGRVLPAGPLREPLKKPLWDADGFILIGEDQRGVLNLLPHDKPVFKASLKLRESATMNKETPYIAFAGLGYPDKFFQFLRDEAGLNIIENVAFSDHHPYQDEDLDMLNKMADLLKAKLITTEKDLIRIPQDKRENITVVHSDLKFKNQSAFSAFLKSKLGGRDDP